MDISFYGVRGSFPFARRDSLKYGGNSSCLLVEHNDTLLILDAGTGIRKLGKELMAGDFGIGQGHTSILITHLMWDHILGLPFFAPIYIKGNVIDIYTAALKDQDLSRLFLGMYDPEYFPIPLSSIKAELNIFGLYSGQPLTIGDIEIVPIRLNHPGVTLGYKLTGRGCSSSFAYITDTCSFDYNFFLGVQTPDLKSNQEMKQDLLKVLKDCDKVVFDTNFTDEEIHGREHWGHSTPTQAVKLCVEAGVKKLYLFHHETNHNDERMDQIEAETRQYIDQRGYNLEIEISREGVMFDSESPEGQDC